jgi:nitrogen-specific signal transduction histidine kinase
MNISDGHVSTQAAKHSAVVLDGSEVLAMRHRLHELANVFTGVVIAAGLLSQYLEGASLRQYAADLCEGSERGCALVRELRSQLLEACGELDAVQDGGACGGAPEDPKIK